ncbi:MAG: hypothetical protein AUI84_02480 [Delftia sp. 13_1_40CM_3_66_6]|nr:MAG: hypothetical protein AUG53_08260 [Delftia sp. 13_1_20CM_4_67_18]OLE95722.1 MAG: hypothetical protein AUI84_02480 [Delftia sp. 13_1_40CM_3_66_6]
MGIAPPLPQNSFKLLYLEHTRIDLIFLRRSLLRKRLDPLDPSLQTLEISTGIWIIFFDTFCDAVTRSHCAGYCSFCIFGCTLQIVFSPVLKEVIAIDDGAFVLHHRATFVVLETIPMGTFAQWPLA